jgi:hypothetical protein
MDIEELENMPDGIVPQQNKTAKQRAEEIYAQMYKITLDRMDAKDCAKIVAERLGRETKDMLWDRVAQELDRLGA